jgi:hypothetical protein
VVRSWLDTIASRIAAAPAVGLVVVIMSPFFAQLS